MNRLDNDKGKSTDTVKWIRHSHKVKSTDNDSEKWTDTMKWTDIVTK